MAQDDLRFTVLFDFFVPPTGCGDGTPSRMVVMLEGSVMWGIHRPWLEWATTGRFRDGWGAHLQGTPWARAVEYAEVFE